MVLKWCSPLKERWILDWQKQLSSEITDITDRFKRPISDRVLSILANHPQTSMLAYKLAPENFRKFLIEKINCSSPITGWQEWEIFKINLNGQEIIILKKRFDTKSKSEYDLQKSAFEILKQANTWVKIPEVFDEFTTDENWYIAMEYINWKTLYTLTWEEIAKSKLIPLIEKTLMLQNKNNIEYSILKSELANGKDLFENDAMTEESIMRICCIMFELQIIDTYPTKTERDPHKPHIKKLPVLENIYKKYLNDVNVFNTEQGNTIQKSLKTALDVLHSEWIYHRDIWGNPRNIMFIREWSYIVPVIIDFWMATKIQKWVQYDYTDNLSGWVYDKDEYILHKIKKLSGESKNSPENSPQDFSKIIWNWEKVGLNITENDIKILSQYKNYWVEKIYQELIEEKWINHGFYIFRNSQNDSFKETSSLKWKKRLFILLSLASTEEKEWLKAKIEQTEYELSDKSKVKKPIITKFFIDLLNQYLKVID